MARKDKSEVFPYVVVLKRKHQRSVDLIGIFAAIIFILLLISKAIREADNRIFLALTVLCASGLLAYNIQLFRRKRKTEIALLYLMAWMGLFFFDLPGKLAFIALALTGYLSGIREEIGFSEKHIVFKSLFRKKILWVDLNNALIKDGILTLDYKNNKLLQAETDDDEDEDEYDVSEEEFNAWCREQLAD